MFEFFWEKISFQNLIDKNRYSGAEGSAIDIIRAIRKELKNTELPTYHKDKLVKAVANSFKNAIDYDTYKSLPETQRREIKQSIAKAIANQFPNLPSIKVEQDFLEESSFRERGGFLSIADPIEESSFYNKANKNEETTTGLTYFTKKYYSEEGCYEGKFSKVKFPEIFNESSEELSMVIQKAIPEKFDFLFKNETYRFIN